MRASNSLRLNCPLAIVAIYGSSAWSARGQPCDYVDLMPAYEEFAAATVNTPPEDRAMAFLRQIADRFPDYYSSTGFGDEAKLKAQATRFFGPAQKTMLPGLPPLTPERLAALARVVGPEFAARQRRFMQVFADFTCDTTVEFGVSLMKFDGHPVDFSGKHHLRFGVDTIPPTSCP